MSSMADTGAHVKVLLIDLHHAIVEEDAIAKSQLPTIEGPSPIPELVNSFHIWLDRHCSTEQATAVDEFYSQWSRANGRKPVRLIEAYLRANIRKPRTNTKLRSLLNPRLALHYIHDYCAEFESVSQEWPTHAERALKEIDPFINAATSVFKRLEHGLAKRLIDDFVYQCPFQKPARVTKLLEEIRSPDILGESDNDDFFGESSEDEHHTFE